MQKFKSLAIAALAAVGFVLTGWATTPRTISINFGSESGIVSGSYGIVPSSSWNNLTGSGNGGTNATATASDGTKVTVHWASSTIWGNSANTDAALKGYLDDGYPGDGSGEGAHIWINSEDMPFANYNVLVYQATDTGSAQFNPPAVNGTWYSYDGSTTGSQNADAIKYGSSDTKTAQVGQNVVQLEKNFSGTLNIKGGTSSSGRGGLAAIQVVEIPVSASVTVDSDMTWSEVLTKAGVTTSAAADLTITASGTPTITFDSCNNLVAGLTVNGAAKFAVTDALYTDGCFGDVLVSGTLSAPDATFADIKTGYKGKYELTTSALTLYAQNREVISINVGGGKGTADTSEAANLVSGSSYYGLYPVPGDSWNNISGRWNSGVAKTVTLSSAKAFDGDTTTVRNTIKLSGMAKNTWQCDSITNPFLRGYLDDGGDGVSVKVTNIPYSQYDVIVYITSDDANYKLRPIKINDTWYTYNSNNELVESTGDNGYDGDEWGAGAVATPAIGQDAICITDVTGADLTVFGYRPTGDDGNGISGRATVCAVQIVSKGELTSKDWTANMTASTTFSGGAGEGLADQSGAWENSEMASITITNTADEATLTLDGTITAASFKIVGAEGKKLHIAKAAGATLNIGGYNLTESAEDVIFDFDPDFTTVDVGTHLIGIGYATNCTIAAGYHYAGTDNVLTGANISGKATIEGSGTLSGEIDVYNNGSVTIGGTYTTAEDATSMLGSTYGTLTVAEGADITVTHIKVQNDSASNTAIFNVNGKVTVTSSSDYNVYSVRGTSGILFGHYFGSTEVNVGPKGSLVGEKCWIQMTYTSGTTMTIDGGTVQALGINCSSSKSSLTVKNGGTLAIGNGGLVSQNNCTWTFDDGTLKSTGTSLYWSAGSMTVGTSGMTIDANGGTVRVESKLTAAGKVTVKNGSVVFMNYRDKDNVTVEDDATVYYGYTVNINNAGKLTLPSGFTASEIKLYDEQGAEVEFSENDGVLTFDLGYEGKVCWWDYEFNNNLNNAGTEGTALTWDGGSPIASDSAYSTKTIPGSTTEVTGIKLPCHPYRGVSSWPDAATFVMYGTMPTENKTVALGFGSATGGSGNVIFLGLDDATAGTVSLNLVNGLSSVATTLCTMTVPNATTADHLYAFVLKTVDGNTVVNTYLDGQLLQPYTYDGTISLGEGFQLGSIHGGLGATGYTSLTTESEGAVAQFLRVYNRELTSTVMKNMAATYPYVSPNGSYRKEVSDTATWTGSWVNESTSATVTAPAAMSTAKLNVGDVATTVSVDLAEDTTYEAITISGDAAVSFARGEGTTGLVKSAGRVTANADVTFAYNAVQLGAAPLTVADNKTVTFDASTLDLGSVWGTTTIQLTGLVTKGEGSTVTVKLPDATTLRTPSWEINSNGHIVITVTVSAEPLCVNISEDGSTTNCTWNGETVTPDLTQQQNDVNYSLESGTLAFSTKATSQGTIMVKTGATFDMNGKYGGDGFNIVLAGGTLKNNNGSGISYYYSQIASLKLTADSFLAVDGNMGLVSGSYGANAIVVDLGGHTLTATINTNNKAFHVCNTTITNGTLKVESGCIEFAQKNSVVDSSATLELGTNAILRINSGITSDIAAIAIEDDANPTLQNNGTLVVGNVTGDFALGGTTKVKTGSTFADGTVTAASGCDLAFESGNAITLDNAILKFANGATITNFVQTMKYTTVNGGGFWIGSEQKINLGTVPASIGAGTKLIFGVNAADKTAITNGLYQSRGTANIDVSNFIIDVVAEAGKVPLNCDLDVFKIVQGDYGTGSFSGTPSFVTTGWKFSTSETTEDEKTVKIGTISRRAGFNIRIR